MNHRVVDANVVVKWYVEEPGSKIARALLDDDETVLISPDIVLAEVGNVLWKRRRRGKLTELQRREIAWLLPGTIVLVSTARLLERALEIAHQADQPIYDCLYVAAAERWNAPLISDDRKLFSALQRAGLGVELMPLA